MESVKQFACGGGNRQGMTADEAKGAASERARIADMLEAEADNLDASKGRLERGAVLRGMAARLRAKAEGE